MKKVFYLGLIFSLIFLACNTDNVLSENIIEDLESKLGVSVSISPFERRGLFFKDVSYGKGSRNQLDFFHGGGFVGGDKSDVFDDYLKETISSILAQNIAIVSANYTFINSSETSGVISAMKDGKAAISFIENHSSVLQLPKNKIVLAGVSAGAGIAQWNGFREETNDQVQGVLALAAQSSYDLYQWENVFQGFSLDEMRQKYPLLEDLYIQFYVGKPTKEERKNLDFRREMDINDPPLYIYNTVGSQEIINTQGEIDFDVLYHSFKHTDYLRGKAIQVGQEFSGAYQEEPKDFIIRLLKF